MRAHLAASASPAGPGPRAILSAGGSQRDTGSSAGDRPETRAWHAAATCCNSGIPFLHAGACHGLNTVDLDAWGTVMQCEKPRQRRPGATQNRPRAGEPCLWLPISPFTPASPLPPGTPTSPHDAGICAGVSPYSSRASRLSQILRIRTILAVSVRITATHTGGPVDMSMITKLWVLKPPARVLCGGGLRISTSVPAGMHGEATKRECGCGGDCRGTGFAR